MLRTDSMFKKLFGNSIAPDCSYCDNCVDGGNSVLICSKKREIIDGRCKGFKYNPLLRVPKASPLLPKFDPKDFEL